MVSLGLSQGLILKPVLPHLLYFTQWRRAQMSAAQARRGRGREEEGVLSAGSVFFQGRGDLYSPKA